MYISTDSVSSVGFAQTGHKLKCRFCLFSLDYMNSIFLWIQLFYEFIYSFLLNIHQFFHVIGVDSMATKEAKKRIKTRESKKRKFKTNIPIPQKQYQGNRLHSKKNHEYQNFSRFRQQLLPCQKILSSSLSPSVSKI